MVATTRRVRDKEDSGGELGEATTGQGSVGSAASMTAVRDGPAADTAGDAGLRPALKRGAKYQRVGPRLRAVGSADDTADSGLETERAEGRALRFAPEPIVHALDAGGTSHRGQTTDWAARRARPGRPTAAERGAAAAARLAAELRATSARQAAAHAAARGLVLAEGLSGTGFPDPARGPQPTARAQWPTLYQAADARVAGCEADAFLLEVEEAVGMPSGLRAEAPAFELRGGGGVSCAARSAARTRRRRRQLVPSNGCARASARTWESRSTTCSSTRSWR